VNGGCPVRSSPAVAGAVVYVGSGDGKVYALNATTGATLWTATSIDAVGSSPAVAGGVVYFAASEGANVFEAVGKVYAYWVP
jgi:outer membrane protein assembly factor BamB